MEFKPKSDCNQIATQTPKQQSSYTQGYWLQFFIPCAYFVYTVWHCTGQHCSSMYACMNHGTPCWVLLQHCYVAKIIFHCRVWYRTLSLSYACIQSSGIILIPYATFVPNFVSFSTSIAELDHGEKSHIQSLNYSLTQLIWCPGNQNLHFRKRTTCTETK